jgi:tRNA-specific 2-thiouridylase
MPSGRDDAEVETMTNRERIAVAMSGGVDSSVAAAILQSEGYEVVGVTLKLQDCESEGESRSCCGIDGMVRARAVAGRLGIRHYELNCVADFESLVLRPAWEEYARGRTPSPCLLCNERIKFGILHEWAREIGAMAVATGHYSRIGRDANVGPMLLRGNYREKDQSYFLAGLATSQLEFMRFPLGEMTKPDVRALAAKLDLPSAETRESQDACLVQKGQSFAEMLRLRFHAESLPGNIIDDDGVVLGKHTGVHRFTVGQRHGIPIEVPYSCWVKGIDAESRTVIVTRDERGLLSQGLVASGMNWIGEPPIGETIDCEAQVRYRHDPVKCRLRKLDGDCVRVEFADPVRAVAPGQAVAFFEGERVLGRGWIDAAD